MQQHTRHLVLVGRVQGVGFRYSMARKARDLGLTGWVRNRADGSVEAVVQGSPEAVARIVAWARHGPPQSAVDHVEVDPDDGIFDAFETRPTA